MDNVLDTLLERGFIQQMTHEEEIKNLLKNEKITFYIGFDPTADSLHIGHFLTVMAMAHMQRAGHRPIALMGAGTAMVGDPTGRTDMRSMMSKETIEHNTNCFKKQLSHFITFDNDSAIIENNANWLCNLNYIDFLRKVGVHFSVNRMLTAECFKTRMEKGLSFLEFNYMLMQSYDFLVLNQKYGCKMQLGGSDQWSNIIGGVELIRRTRNENVYGMTFTLLTTSEGKKMGKTMGGAVWLDSNKTSPYEFYQYWRNIDDRDVERCLALLTFLPMEEVRRLGSLKDEKINEAKEVLAYEVTKIVHSQEEAEKAEAASKALFKGGANTDSIPTTYIEENEIKNGIDIISLLQKVGLIPSRTEGRRLIEQKGVKINESVVNSIDYKINTNDFKDNILLLQKGKKVFRHISIK